MSPNASRLEEALARHAHELAVLYETSLEINAQTDLTTLLRTIVQRQAELTGGQGSNVYLLEPDGETLRTAVTLRATEKSGGVSKVGRRCGRARRAERPALHDHRL